MKHQEAFVSHISAAQDMARDGASGENALRYRAEAYVCRSHARSGCLVCGWQVVVPGNALPHRRTQRVLPANRANEEPP